MNKKRLVFIIIGIIIMSITVLLLYLYNSILHKQYTNEDFKIETYVSNIDKDNDGIDDQTDILNNVRNYISKNPKYKSKYYETGYPNDEYGVCTDVVAFGLKDAGYDLMELVNEDIHNNREKYNIENVDKNIDFRRVRNLDIYFRNNHIALTIVFKDHIGIISDKRNKKGIPLLIHHANPLQVNYEEDVLELYGQDYIIGHYRIS